MLEIDKFDIPGPGSRLVARAVDSFPFPISVFCGSGSGNGRSGTGFAACVSPLRRASGLIPSPQRLLGQWRLPVRDRLAGLLIPFGKSLGCSFPVPRDVFWGHEGRYCPLSSSFPLRPSGPSPVPTEALSKKRKERKRSVSIYVMDLDQWW